MIVKSSASASIIAKAPKIESTSFLFRILLSYKKSYFLSFASFALSLKLKGLDSNSAIVTGFDIKYP